MMHVKVIEMILENDTCLNKVSFKECVHDCSLLAQPVARCNRTSLSSTTCWRMLIFCSLESLSSGDSAASLSLICCSLASLQARRQGGARGCTCTPLLIWSKVMHSSYQEETLVHNLLLILYTISSPIL